LGLVEFKTLIKLTIKDSLMFIIKPYIFNQFPEIIFGLSTKIGGTQNSSFDYNLSYSVGDDVKLVEQNRKLFLNAIGLDVNSVAFQNQIHSGIIKIVDCAGNNGESDALITNKKNLGLGIIVADCTPIFIYDYKAKVIAAVHSGWRGTEQKILYNTLQKLKKEFNSKMENITAYIGPSISANNYEVGNEVAQKFESKYVIKKDNKYFLDVSGCNYDMLLDSGVPQNQIQKSVLCTYEFKTLFHSYRRDGEKSGRSLGVIAIKE
jgi:hypothetical protein